MRWRNIIFRYKGVWRREVAVLAVGSIHSIFFLQSKRSCSKHSTSKWIFFLSLSPGKEATQSFNPLILFILPSVCREQSRKERRRKIRQDQEARPVSSKPTASSGLSRGKYEGAQENSAATCNIECASWRVDRYATHFQGKYFHRIDICGSIRWPTQASMLAFACSYVLYG